MIHDPVFWIFITSLIVAISCWFSMIWAWRRHDRK